MELLMPKLGLFVWTLLIFLIFFFVLAKFAWKPILKAIKAREESIEESLREALKAREEMANLKSGNEKLLREAREEREKILREARQVRDQILAEAKNQASEESSKILERARVEIDNQKMAALTEIRNYSGKLSLEIAEKILRGELSDKSRQEAFAQKMIAELQPN